MQQMPTNLVAGNNTYSSALGSVNQKSGYGMAGFPAGGITEINALARLRSLAGAGMGGTGLRRYRIPLPISFRLGEFNSLQL